MTEELMKTVENAMGAFNEYKGMVEGFDAKLKTIAPKLDAFDETKLNKLAETIGGAIEESQKAAAKAKAMEDQVKAQDKEIEGLRTAFNRVGAAGGENDAKSKQDLFKKAFNAFARMDTGSRQMYFDEFVKSRAADDAEFKALSVNNDPNGGYTVFPEKGGVIQTFIYESSPIRQLATVTQVGTSEYEVITDNDQSSSGWVGETQARTDTTTPQLGLIKIPVNELYAQPKATQKLLDDSEIDIESWLADKVSQKFARDEATAFVSGNGVMKPKGLLSYASGTDTTQQQIQQVVTGDAANFTLDGLVNLQVALKESYQRNAMFLTQRTNVGNLMLIKDGIGHPILNLMVDKNVGLEPTIMGRPLRFAADVPAVAANALAMIYGDIRAAYQIVDRAGIRVLRDPFTSKPYVVFYTTRRVGGAVINFEAVKLQQIHV